jgi:hypothetical protein
MAPRALLNERITSEVFMSQTRSIRMTTDLLRAEIEVLEKLMEVNP